MRIFYSNVNVSVGHALSRVQPKDVHAHMEVTLVQREKAENFPLEFGEFAIKTQYKNF